MIQKFRAAAGKAVARLQSIHAAVVAASPKPLKPVVNNADMIAWSTAMWLGMGGYIASSISNAPVPFSSLEKQAIEVVTEPIIDGIAPGRCGFRSGQKRHLYFVVPHTSMAIMGVQQAATLFLAKRNETVYDLGLIPAFTTAGCSRVPPGHQTYSRAELLQMAEIETAESLRSPAMMEAKRKIPPDAKGFFIGKPN